MKPDHLHLVVPPPDMTIVDPPKPHPWWLAPEFLALAELRRTMVPGAVPSKPPETAEESARDAVFWVLFELEHIVRELGKRLEAGEPVHLRKGVYIYTADRVDFNVRIVEHTEGTMQPPRGTR
jgi:hypothetical protein